MKKETDKPFLWLLAIIVMMTVSLAANAQADFPGTHFDFTQKAAATTTIDDITLTHNGNYQSARNALQLNSGKSATITAPKGYNITQVTLVNTSNLAYTSWYYEPTLATIGANCGTSTLSADNQTLTWTGSESSVTFTTKNTIHVDEWDFDATACSYVASFYVVVERDASVDLEHITMSPSDFRPGPDDDIVIDVANGQTFQGINYIYPSDVTIDPACAGTVYLDINGRRTETTLYVYDTQALFSFANAITKTGECVISIPAGVLKATDGRTNNAITLNYNVGAKHLKYKVNLQLGGGIMPNGTTISVAGQPYKHGDVVTTTTALTDADVIAAVDGYGVTGITVNQPFTVGETSYDGSIIVNYEKLIVPLELSGVKMGWDGEVVTTSGTQVEQVGVLLLQFAEPIELAEGADVEGITVTDDKGQPCQLYDSKYVTDGMFFLWVNPAKTAVGTYRLHVPAGLFKGTESELLNGELFFDFVIADIATFTPETSIADGDTVDVLTELTLTAPEGVTFSHFTSYPDNYFFLRGAGINENNEKIYNAAAVADDGHTATLRLGNIKRNGEYTITIPKGYLRSTDANTGNAEMVIRVNVDHAVLPGDANDNGIVDSADVETARYYMLGRSYGMGSDDDAVLKALDFNGDGKITIGDLTKLIDKISK